MKSRQFWFHDAPTFLRIWQPHAVLLGLFMAWLALAMWNWFKENHMEMNDSAMWCFNAMVLLVLGCLKLALSAILDYRPRDLDSQPPLPRPAEPRPSLSPQPTRRRRVTDPE